MKRVLWILGLTGLALTGWNQKANGQVIKRSCASYEHLQQQLAEHPEMAQERQQIESYTQQYSQRHLFPTGKQTAAIYTIPVVVHVLYKTAAQNISDAQIQSQIAALNTDYQLLNADAANTPAAFAGLKADCQIQFCLAQRTPTGAATNGIIRKSTTKTSFSADNDNAKHTSTGGDDAWDRNQYLNLWVVPAITSGGQSGILGYAQFPGGPAATDGVVIGYNYFGTTGVVSAPYNKGRTATHEIGHWLNLNHIWGDDGTACTGSDNVGDTPNQGSENYGCPSFPHISCSNGPNGDMFMNYMDYTDDACMFMFTTGQKSRMHAVLAPGGSRAAITASQGCSAPGGGSTCSTPASLNATGITTTGATLGWTGSASATNYNLQWKAATAASWNTVTGVSGTTYTLSGLAAGTAYSFQVQANCSGTTSAYSSPASFTTSSGGCSDNYEPNNSLTAAAAISANGSITGLISSTTDKDYFQFTNSSTAPKIKVTLTNLPGDYDLKLYNSSGTLLGTSQNGGTTSESLVYNTTTVGTYYAYVYGYNGANSATQCYNLSVQTGAANFRESAGTAGIPGKSTIALYPNPARGEVYFDYYSAARQDAVVTIVDQSGRVVKTVGLVLEAGSNQPKLNVSELPAGLYFVRIVTGEELLTAKVMIQR